MFVVISNIVKLRGSVMLGALLPHILRSVRWLEGLGRMAKVLFTDG
jgi:hypothetical protein